MLPLLPIMIGLTAEELLAGTVLGAAAAVGLAAAADQFRRGGAEAIATGTEGLATLAEKVADAVAGANLPVGFGPPPNWNPLGDGLAAIKGAADFIWDHLNNNNSTASGAVGDYLINNPTGQTIKATFSAYTGYNWPQGEGEWVALVGNISQIVADNPWVNLWADYNWISFTFDLPPGSSGASLEHHMTGNPNPNGRDDYWSATVNGVTKTIGIFDYRPGQFLPYAIISIPSQASVSGNSGTIAKPREVAPKPMESAPAALAAPLPAAVGDWIDYGYLGIPQPAAASKATAPLPAVAPIPRPLPLPAAPVPQKATDLDRAGQPVPQAAPAVKPTATTDHMVGQIAVPARAPQATMQGIAEEVGRIEQKMAMMLNPGDLADKIDWMDNIGKLIELLMSATAGGEYTLSSKCELDANGQRIVKSANFSGSLDRIGVIENKIDALAELMQHDKDLKQPSCIPSVPPSTVTVTAYEVMGN